MGFEESSGRRIPMLRNLFQRHTKRLVFGRKDLAF